MAVPEGVSTNDFGEALRAPFGESVGGLSPASVVRLKEGWDREYAQWRKRAWHGEEFVYLWADGIYVNVRGEERRCLLVVVGCDARGRKRFLALESGYRDYVEFMVMLSSSSSSLFLGVLWVANST